MVEAQRVACKNDVGVDISFAATADGYVTPETSAIKKGQQQVIELAYYPFPEGLAFLPDVYMKLTRRKLPPPPPPPITFTMNGRTAFYDVTGTVQNWEVKFSTLGDPSGRPTLPGFPANIPLNVLPYNNWDHQINSPGILTCAPQSADDVAAVCNWAKDNGYQVRPRGVMHGWSPLTLPTNPDPQAKIMLVDLTKGLFQATFLPPANGLPNRVKVQTGKTMLELLKYLEGQAGGKGSAPGYSFPHTPAPGNLTVGGVLAIDAHGTAVPTKPNDDFQASYGSMSNQILEFTAVVTDPNSGTPNQYVLRTFKRGESDAKVFLAHLGRAMLVEATLQVIDNYNLRCQSFTNFSESVVFAAPTSTTPIPPDSFGDYLNRCGRVEVIWYRTGTNPWLHVWSVAPTKPEGSTAVTSPYNYPFADNVPERLQSLIKEAVTIAPWVTPAVGTLAAYVTTNGLDGINIDPFGKPYPPSRDIWGPSKNTLLYIQDTTLQVTANGYALQMKKTDVQQAVFDFTTQFTSLLASYEKDWKYPVNAAVEIRVTSLDDPASVAIGSGITAESPVISALSYDGLAKQKGWEVALWVDVLTIPGTNYSNEFYADLEAWLLQRFSGNVARTLPEWSKGWAYTKQGAWTNTGFLDHIRQAFTAGPNDQNNWKFEVETLKKYDKSNLFTNPLLDQLFTS